MPKYSLPLHIPAWLVLAMLGVLTGLSIFTFVYARGASYFLDDPKACLNCHIMREEFDAWNRGSHHAVTTCNSCHAPHGLLGKYATKAINGWNHSVAFTTGNFSDPVRIRPFNRDIVLANCLYCHSSVIDRMARNAKGQQADCLHCHGNVGHPSRR
jgi:cytochrome c nitrite reductase small subunit